MPRAIEVTGSGGFVEVGAGGASIEVTFRTATGGGGGAVASVNGQTGAVVLDAADVGAATAAQGALADTATQPGDLGTAAALDVGTGSGDVAAGDAPASAVSTHNSDTTSVHGIADTSALVVDGDPASSLVVGTLDGNLSAVSEGTVEDAIQAVDDLSLGGSVAIPISPSGQWMMAAGGVRPEEGTFSWYNGHDGGTTYIHYHAPFQPVSSYRITDVMVEIVTALASNNVRVGLVVLGQDGQPDSLVSNIGTIDASSTGRKSISGLTIDLTAGVWYCFCSLNVGGGGSIAARCFYGGGMGVGSWGSSNDVLNRSKSDARVTLSGETYYASGFPDPPDDWTHLLDPPGNNYAGPREIWQVKIGATP